MILLVIFAFLGGLVTIASPCILPILPIILTGSLTGSRSRPFGVVAGFIISFTFFTLFLSTLVRSTGISADFLRLFSIVLIAGFGLTLLLPKFQVLMERLFTGLSNLTPQTQNRPGFKGGFVLGLSLGLIWTPCVGPILASVITLAASSSVNAGAVFITLAYSLGTAIPMLAIIYGGRQLLNKVPWLTANSSKIQKAFGVLMILTALAIFTNLDRKFQSYVLNKFPSYGTGLTSLEDNQIVKSQLGQVSQDLQPAPEIIPGGQWFNSKPLTLQELRGKVVLLDFWTYTCINCIRTFPYLKDWHEKYADKGLVIIGVHTPEFEFEKNPDNLSQAIKDFGLNYPIVQDNNYATWRAYNNRYWPAKYFIDKDGRIRSTHFGEGDYDQSELMIQKLLKEAGADLEDMAVSNPSYSVQASTPEIYLGFQRAAGFDSPGGLKHDQTANYNFSAGLGNNQFAFQGSWQVGKEYAAPGQGAKLQLNFSAQKAFLVMRTKNGEAGQVKVFLDDQEKETITVKEDKLYQLIELPQPGRHILRLEFQDSNLELYAFTFG